MFISYLLTTEDARIEKMINSIEIGSDTHKQDNPPQNSLKIQTVAALTLASVLGHLVSNIFTGLKNF